MMNVPQTIYSKEDKKILVYLGADLGGPKGYKVHDGEKIFHIDSKKITHFVYAKGSSRDLGRPFVGTPILFKNGGSAGYFDTINKSKEIVSKEIEAIKVLMAKGEILPSCNASSIVKPIEFFGDNNCIDIRFDILGIRFSFILKRESRLWWRFRTSSWFQSRAYPFNSRRFFEFDFDKNISDIVVRHYKIGKDNKREEIPRNGKWGIHIKLFNLSLVDKYEHTRFEWFKFESWSGW